jgi:hypothetical protein
VHRICGCLTVACVRDLIRSQRPGHCPGSWYGSAEVTVDSQPHRAVQRFDCLIITLIRDATPVMGQRLRTQAARVSQVPWRATCSATPNAFMAALVNVQCCSVVNIITTVCRKAVRDADSGYVRVWADAESPEATAPAVATPLANASFGIRTA